MRILIFYVGSIFVIVAVLPWDDPAVEAGPFSAVLNTLHVPGVGLVMDLIVVVALLSAMNANIYGASRMAYSLGSADWRRWRSPARVSRACRTWRCWRRSRSGSSRSG